jgi:hypothetical protein
MERWQSGMDFHTRTKASGLHEFIAADPDRNLFRVFPEFASPESA